MGKPVEMNDNQVRRVIELMGIWLRKKHGREFDFDTDAFIYWLEEGQK